MVFSAVNRTTNWKRAAQSFYTKVVVFLLFHIICFRFLSLLGFFLVFWFFLYVFFCYCFCLFFFPQGTYWKVRHALHVKYKVRHVLTGYTTSCYVALRHGTGVLWKFLFSNSILMSHFNLIFLPLSLNIIQRTQLIGIAILRRLMSENNMLRPGWNNTMKS